MDQTRNETISYLRFLEEFRWNRPRKTHERRAIRSFEIRTEIQ